jgi:hypothetical protein
VDFFVRKRVEAAPVMFPVFVVVFSPLIGFGLPGGDDTHPFAPYGVGHEQQSAFHHTDYPITFFAFAVLFIEPVNGEGVTEYVAGHSLTVRRASISREILMLMASRSGLRRTHRNFPAA